MDADVYYDELGKDMRVEPIPEDMMELAQEYRTKLLDACADIDEEIMMLVLEEQEVPQDMIRRAIRKGTVWLLTGALALFTLYLTVSGAAAGSADTVTARLARSAVGVLPVVGSILADAADSVLAGAGAVKNTVGAAGLLAVLAVCLLPLVRLGVQYLVYKAAAFLAGILGAEQLTGLIDTLGGAFGLIFGMTGACGLLLLISISSALGVVTG